jgi:acyl-CoA thioesterase-1
MTRIAPWFGVCFLLACGRGGEGDPAAAAPPAAPLPARDARPAVVFLGDSLTSGLGLSADEAPPAVVERLAQDAGIAVRAINGGRSGDTSAGGLSRLDWYLRPEVGLGALVVNLGSNDALRGLSLDELEKNLAAIVARTRAAVPAARVFVVQLETFPNLGPEYSAGFRAVFPRVAAASGATLVPFPLEGIATVPELNQPDGIHPNAEGARRMGAALFRALEPELRALTRPR